MNEGLIAVLFKMATPWYFLQNKCNISVKLIDCSTDFSVHLDLLFNVQIQSIDFQIVYI